jgi:hypothetical protein
MEALNRKYGHGHNVFSNDAILQSSCNKHFKKILYSHSFHLSYKRNEILILRRIMELPANDIVRVNKFDNLQKLYLQTIISVFHISQQTAANTRLRVS